MRKPDASADGGGANLDARRVIAAPLRPQFHRWPFVILGLVAVAIYIIVVLMYAGGLRGSSSSCETIIPGEDPVTVELQPVGVNAASQRLDFKMTLVPSNGLLSADGYTATETISVVAFPVDGDSLLTFPEGEVLDTSIQSNYAQGAVEQWPFDVYRSNLTTFAFTGEDDEADHSHTALPTRICLDDSVPGWRLHTETITHLNHTVTTASGVETLPTVEITATRSLSTVAFGMVLLGLMALTPMLVLFVAISAYTGRRRVEATLTSWIGAMLFAIIPLRAFLPGSPPVGSWIDYLVVLWVIVGLVTGLAIYILAWNRWGRSISSTQPFGILEDSP